MRKDRRSYLMIPLLLLFSILFVACGNDDAGIDDAIDEEVIPGEEAVAILDNLSDHEGEEVTVVTTVAEPIGDRGMAVHSHATSGDTVLVLAPEAPDVTEGDIVEITGTVREFDADAASEEDVDPADPAYEPYLGDHVVIASQVSVVEGS